MILRVLTGRTTPERVDELRRRAERVLIGDHRPPGLILATFGCQHEQAVERFVFASEWRDLTSLYAWLGCSDLLCSPRLLDGLEDGVTEVEIQHYEILSTTVDDREALPDQTAGSAAGWRLPERREARPRRAGEPPVLEGAA